MVSVDMTTISSDAETIDFDDGRGRHRVTKRNCGSARGDTYRAASPVKQAVETPRQMSKTQERPKLRTDMMGDFGSHKRAKKAPLKPCKPGLRSATK
jgi:hypothetical protein